MQILDKNLARISDQGRLRHLAPARGLDFASNDYLQMRQHPGLRAAAVEDRFAANYAVFTTLPAPQ